MTIDTQGVQDFEGGFSALLDLLDNLRTLPAPTQSEGIRGLFKWHDEVRKILSMSPELPDTVALTQFAEDTDRALSEIDGKASAAQGGGTEKANPRDDGLLITPQWFWAEIVTDATGGAYTFKEKNLTDGTTWADLTGGRTGTCYEANDVAGIAVGAIIKIRVEYDTGGTLRYVFNASSAIPAGTADWDILVWDQTTDKAWEVLAKADANYKVLQRKADDSIGWDWVRAH